MTTNVKLVRLLTGEMLLADVKAIHGSDGLTLKEPVVISLHENPQQAGQFGVRIDSWLQMTQQKEIDIKNEHILFTAEPSPELLNHYNRLFGSGIVVAAANELPKPGTTTLKVVK